MDFRGSENLGEDIRNALYPDCGSGFMAVYNCQNPSICTF